MSGIPAPERWTHPARQARSRATAARIVAAALALLEEKGLHELTIPEVAQRAGCAVGTFYRRFPDKQALLETLFETFEAEAAGSLQAFAATVEDPRRPLREAVRAAVGALLAFYRVRGGLIRALQIGSETEPRFERRAARVQARVADAFERMLRARRSEFAHPDPARAADFLLWILLGVLNQRLAFAPMRTELSDAHLAGELERTLLGYLGAQGDTDE